MSRCQYKYYTPQTQGVNDFTAVKVLHCEGVMVRKNVIRVLFFKKNESITLGKLVRFKSSKEVLFLLLLFFMLAKYDDYTGKRSKSFILVGIVSPFFSRDNDVLGFFFCRTWKPCLDISMRLWRNTQMQR